MNISNPNIKHPCTGCQVCGAICPKEAIRIELSEEGFYHPLIDPKKCIDCSLCVQICYKYNNIQISDFSKLASMEVWAATAKNEKVLSETTSGGVADILCRSLIQQEYKCIGVSYDTEKTCAISKIATNEEETLSFRGSKYIQSYTLEAFREILSDKNKGKYAVFGTPCHIYAIDRYLQLRKRRNNFLLIDVYCHGCPSLLLWKKYMNEVSLLTGQKKFDTIEFRSKIKGWGNFYVRATTNGKESFVSNRKKNEFYTLFFSDLALNKACYSCDLRSTLGYTDIRLGDFWGKCYDFNRKGVSVVTLINEKGKKAFKEIHSQLNIKKHTFEDFLPYQSYGKYYSLNEACRTKIISQIADPNIPLSKVVDFYYSQQPFIMKLKRIMKNIILLFPPRLIALVKRIYH